MFTCSGTLNSITIPYSTIAGITWKDKLELELTVWRRQSEGVYSQAGEDMKVKVDIHQETTVRMTGRARWGSPIDVQKYDILKFTIREYDGMDKRKHIPYLLTAYQPPGYTEPVTVPLIQVDFSGQPEEGIV